MNSYIDESMKYAKVRDNQLRVCVVMEGLFGLYQTSLVRGFHPGCSLCSFSRMFKVLIKMNG